MKFFSGEGFLQECEQNPPLVTLGYSLFTKGEKQAKAPKSFLLFQKEVARTRDGRFGCGGRTVPPGGALDRLPPEADRHTLLVLHGRCATGLRNQQTLDSLVNVVLQFDLVAGAGLEPATTRLWALRATTALPRDTVGNST